MPGTRPRIRRRATLLAEVGVSGPLADFELDRPLARGGMGEVWRAVHVPTGRPVAIKVVRPEITRQRRAFVEAYEREIRAVAALDHPRIVEVLAGGTLEPDPSTEISGPWLAMELARASLADLDVPDWGAAASVADALLAALGHAHARGILHRDVKPANVLDCGTTARPRWKLADFGLARIGSDPAIAGGTPGFQAPEQLARDAAEGPWTDLYAAAAVIWTLACGASPDAAPFRPRFPVPASLVGFLDRGLARDPADRWDRAWDARAALRALERDAERLVADLATTPAPARDSETFVLDAEPSSGGAAPVRRPEPRGPAPDWRAAEPPDPAFSARHRVRMRVGGRSLFALRPLPLVGRDAQRDRLWALLVRVARDRSTVRVLVRGPPGSGRSRLVGWLAEAAHELGVADPDGAGGRPALTIAEDVDVHGLPEVRPHARGRLVVATAAPPFEWPGAELVEVAPLDAWDGRVLAGVLGVGAGLASVLHDETLGRPGLATRLVLAGLRDGRWDEGDDGLRRRPHDGLPVLDEERAALAAWSGSADALALAVAVPGIDEPTYVAACARLGLDPVPLDRLDLGAARAALAEGRRDGRSVGWCRAVADVLPADVHASVRGFALAGARAPGAFEALAASLARGSTSARDIAVADRLDEVLDDLGAPPCDPRRAVAVCGRVRRGTAIQSVGPAEAALAQQARCDWGLAVEADLRVSYASALRTCGRPAEALAEVRRGLDLARRADNVGTQISACSTMITILCNLGRADEAVEWVAVYRELAVTPVDRAFAAYHAGFVATMRRRYEEAEAWLLPIAELSHDDLNLQAGVNAELGEIARRRGRLDEALGWYRAAARMGRATGTADLSYANIALVHVERGEWAAAEAIALASRWDPTARTNRFLGAAMTQIAALVAAQARDLPAFDAAWEDFEELISRSGVRDPDFVHVGDRVAAFLAGHGERERTERVRSFVASLSSART